MKKRKNDKINDKIEVEKKEIESKNNDFNNLNISDEKNFDEKNRTEKDKKEKDIEKKDIEEKKLNKKEYNNKKAFSTAEVILLFIISLIIGISLGKIISKPTIISKNNINISKDENLMEFIENYEYIVNNYYEDVDREKLISNAISGMMESIGDPHSVYFDESESNNFSINLNGSYEGIGIEIFKEDSTGYMVVNDVFENSPAAEAGIKKGDKIISVDDKQATNFTTSEFSNFIINNSKNTFSFKILRDDKEQTILLKRKSVELKSVSSKIIDNDKKIGYIYIGIFANNTYKQFKNALDKLEKEKIKYLIIDVRNNTGGHLTTVENIIDLFLNKKQIMYKIEKNGKISDVYAKGNENKKYEIILLGDTISASASEVLISSLKENLNSVFIGKKTYGKGTVQELVTLSDGTQYKLTVKKWLTPKGNWVNDTNGIEPDIEIDLDSKYYETGLDEDDSQLQKAIEYINSK